MATVRSIPIPNSEQLADIAISSAETASYVWRSNPGSPCYHTPPGSRAKENRWRRFGQATEIARERRPDLKIEGPIQYDAAVDTSVAKTKLPESEVAGHATVFHFP